MAEDGAGGHGARVCESLFEPDVRVLEAFREEVAQDGMELVADLAVDFDAVVDGFGLRVGDEFAAVAGFEVFGVVALVRGQEVVVQWAGVLDEFDDARRGGQGEDFVGPDAEIALAGGSLGFQQAADLVEDLLHYGVLSKIIAAALELRCVSLHFALRCYDHLPVVCTSNHPCQRR